MGASVAGIACGREGAFLFNVGDARVYREQDGFLQLVTKDDSIAQLLVETGQAAPDEVRPANIHQITQAIGGKSEPTPIAPHIEALKLTRPRRFLLCSDGLTDMVAIDRMENILSKHSPATEAVAELFRAAMEAGGEDNATIIVAEISLASS
jgi:serine/threonine protein phosphatase PrpC